MTREELEKFQQKIHRQVERDCAAFHDDTVNFRVFYNFPEIAGCTEEQLQLHYDFYVAWAHKNLPEWAKINCPIVLPARSRSEMIDFGDDNI